VGTTKAELLRRRSRMSKDQLTRAVAKAKK
jgi:hypothetical protein